MHAPWRLVTNDLRPSRQIAVGRSAFFFDFALAELDLEAPAFDFADLAFDFDEVELDVPAFDDVPLDAPEDFVPELAVWPLVDGVAAREPVPTGALTADGREVVVAAGELTATEAVGAA